MVETASTIHLFLHLFFRVTVLDHLLFVNPANWGSLWKGIGGVLGYVGTVGRGKTGVSGTANLERAPSDTATPLGLHLHVTNNVKSRSFIYEMYNFVLVKFHEFHGFHITRITHITRSLVT